MPANAKPDSFPANHWDRRKFQFPIQYSSSINSVPRKKKLSKKGQLVLHIRMQIFGHSRWEIFPRPGVTKNKPESADKSIDFFSRFYCSRVFSRSNLTIICGSSYARKWERVIGKLGRNSVGSDILFRHCAMRKKNGVFNRLGTYLIECKERKVALPRDTLYNLTINDDFFTRWVCVLFLTNCGVFLIMEYIFMINR